MAKARRIDREPALGLVATELCALDMTDGFCSPATKGACQCWTRAGILLRESGFSAQALVWILRNRKRIEQEAANHSDAQPSQGQSEPEPCGCVVEQCAAGACPATSDSCSAIQAIERHIEGWKSATFGWHGSDNPEMDTRNRAVAVEAHAAECLRRIRVTLGVQVDRAADLDKLLTQILSRRVTIEQRMFDAASGKRPMPTAEELRQWAIELGTPAVGVQASEAQRSADERMRHDYPLLQQFYGKHALGALAAPSCLCCGHQTGPDRPIAVQHMELPAIVVCKLCKDAPGVDLPRGGEHGA